MSIFADLNSFIRKRTRVKSSDLTSAVFKEQHSSNLVPLVTTALQPPPQRVRPTSHIMDFSKQCVCLYRIQKDKYKLLCPRGTQTCALAVANIAHAVYLLDVPKRPIPQG